jgi:hypothetical protein
VASVAGAVHAPSMKKPSYSWVTSTAGPLVGHGRSRSVTAATAKDI